MSLNPELPVQIAISFGFAQDRLNGLGDMLGLDIHRIRQVGDGAGYLQNTVVGPPALRSHPGEGGACPTVAL